jgi:exosome complex exonuclease DIS3/RRP44
VVFVPRYGIEGPVFLTDKEGGSSGAEAAGSQQQQQFVLDEDKQALVAADGSARYAVFDKCAVRVSVVEGAARRRSIRLELVPRSELAPGDIVA